MHTPMPRIRYDATISLSTILQLIVMLLALWGATTRLESRLTALEVKLDPVWHWFTEAGPRAVPGRE